MERVVHQSQVGCWIPQFLLSLGRTLNPKLHLMVRECECEREANCKAHLDKNAHQAETEQHSPGVISVLLTNLSSICSLLLALFLVYTNYSLLSLRVWAGQINNELSHCHLIHYFKGTLSGQICHGQDVYAYQRSIFFCHKNQTAKYLSLSRLQLIAIRVLGIII